jgi:hypothetical protein
LHGVVVGNQDGGSHGVPRTLLMYRIGALSPMPINARLIVGNGSRAAGNFKR